MKKRDWEGGKKNFSIFIKKNLLCMYFETICHFKCFKQVFKLSSSKVYRVLLGSVLFEFFEIKTIKQNNQTWFGRANWRHHLNNILVTTNSFQTFGKFIDKMKHILSIYFVFLLNLNLIINFLPLMDTKTCYKQNNRDR